MELSLTNILFCCHRHSVKPRKVSENAEEIRLKNGDGTKSKRSKDLQDKGTGVLTNCRSPVASAQRL